MSPAQASLPTGGGTPLGAIGNLVFAPLIHLVFLVGFVVIVAGSTATLITSAWIVILFWVPSRGIANALGHPLERYLRFWSVTAANFGSPIGYGARTGGAVAGLSRALVKTSTTLVFIGLALFLGIATMLVFLLPILGTRTAGRAWGVFTGLWILVGRLGFTALVRVQNVRPVLPTPWDDPGYEVSDPLELPDDPLRRLADLANPGSSSDDPASSQD